MNKELVVKSNHVIEASYRLTLSEQRLILLCVRQIKKGQAVDKTDTFEVSATDFAEMFDISADRAYSELQAVADRLYERSVTVQQPDPENPRIAATKTRWVCSISYIPTEGRIALSFAPKMLPYIAMLENGFTRYNLEHIAPMSSVYGIRFYEFFKCWLRSGVHGEKRLSLDELKEKLDLTNKYPSIKDFKLKVLDRAMSDINEHSDLSTRYRTAKTGRRITHVEFTFAVREPEAKGKAVKGKAQPVIDEALIRREARPGETWEQVRQRLSKAE